jgi:hypothetical protein
MADFFNHNIPDDPNSVLGPPGTSVADMFRRAAASVYGSATHMWNDPGRTMLPWTSPVGAVARQLPAAISNHFREASPDAPGWKYFSAPKAPPVTDDDSFAGKYAGPWDMFTHFLGPGYVPQQELQNLIDRDPLAGLLGPIQKPAPRPTAVEPGY